MNHPMHRSVAASLLIASAAVVGLAFAADPAVTLKETNQAKLRLGLGAALRADGWAAVSLLEGVQPDALEPPDRTLRSCVLQRLGQPYVPSNSSSVVATVVGAYQAYWHHSLRAEGSAAENEARLLAAINLILQSNGGQSAPTLSETEEPLKALLRSHGQHALLGRTSPLHELMLWTDETEQQYAVPLPEGTQQVVVSFLDAFTSLGWAGYATCNRHHTGGWATTDRLYAVRSSYDISSERFRVSYLGHEAQHFSDYQRFPQVTKQEILEYRAKLAEIAMAQASTHALIEFFRANTSDDPTRPHAFANRLLLRNLRDSIREDGFAEVEWANVPAASISKSAAALLRRDSEMRN